MFMRPVDWLIATAAFPLLGTIGVLVALTRKNRHWELLLARFGMAGGTVCGVALATLLGGREETLGSVQVSLWKWFSFSSSQAPSITFGLEANFIKASLFGLIGVIALVALWKANQVKHPFSDDLILTNSLLYAAGAFFIFSPNLAQSLMGWGAISLLSRILFRLSKQDSGTNGSQGDALQARSVSLRPSEPAGGGGHHVLSLIADLVRLLEWGFCQIERWLKMTFPNWLSDQTDVISTSPVTFQFLAAILGTSVILLTWLFTPVG